jgi:hypothetical protein
MNIKHSVDLRNYPNDVRSQDREGDARGAAERNFSKKYGAPGGNINIRGESSSRPSSSKVVSQSQQLNLNSIKFNNFVTEKDEGENSNLAQPNSATLKKTRDNQRTLVSSSSNASLSNLRMREEELNMKNSKLAMNDKLLAGSRSKSKIGSTEIEKSTSRATNQSPHHRNNNTAAENKAKAEEDVPEYRKLQEKLNSLENKILAIKTNIDIKAPAPSLTNSGAITSSNLSINKVSYLQKSSGLNTTPNAASEALGSNLLQANSNYFSSSNNNNNNNNNNLYSNNSSTNSNNNNSNNNNSLSHGESNHTEVKNFGTSSSNTTSGLNRQNSSTNISKNTVNNTAQRNNKAQQRWKISVLRVRFTEGG